MILVVTAVGFGLLALPAAVHAIGSRIRPREWAVASAVTLFAGAGLVLGTLFLIGATATLEAIGSPELARCCRSIMGNYLGNAGVSTLALVFGLSAVTLGAKSWLRARRSARRARMGGNIGTCVRRQGSFDVVVLPDDRSYALSVPDGPRLGLVLLSRGAINALTPPELDLVCAHEAAHLRHGHRRYLVLALLVEESLWFWPPVRRSTDTLRLAIERWADEVAVGDSCELRFRLRRALLAVAGVVPLPALAAFGAVDGLSERLSALEVLPRTPRLGWRFLFVATGVLLGFIALYASYGLAHEALCVFRCFSDPHSSR